MTDEDLKKIDELIEAIKELTKVEKERNEILDDAYNRGWGY